MFGEPKPLGDGDRGRLNKLLVVVFAIALAVALFHVAVRAWQGAPPQWDSWVTVLVFGTLLLLHAFGTQRSAEATGYRAMIGGSIVLGTFLLQFASTTAGHVVGVAIAAAACATDVAVGITERRQLPPAR